MLKTIGKKLITGNFNLTTVSFPIKCMCAKSTLESIGELSGVNPLFINAAALSSDPIERMIMAMTSAIAYFYPTHMFEKPVSESICLLTLCFIVESNSWRNILRNWVRWYTYICWINWTSPSCYSFLIRGTIKLVSNVWLE